MYALRSIHNADSGELVSEHKLTHVKYLSDSVDFVLCDAQCNVRIVREDINLHHSFLTSEATAEVVELYKRMLRPRSYGSLLCSALQFGPRYRMPSRAGEQKNNEGTDSKSCATKDGER